MYCNTLVEVGVGRVNDKFESANAKRGKRLRKSSLQEAKDQFDAFPMKQPCAFLTTLSSEQEADINRQFLQILYGLCATNQFPFICVKAGSSD